jgi:nucleoside-diphosphate-sugar epimerase
MKSALVSGGLGFIGSHLVDLLLSKGIEVIIIDTFVNNCIDDYPGCQIIADNIPDAIGMRYDVDDVDAVFHLASTVGPVGVLSHSGDMAGEIINDTIVLRDFCIEERIKFIYVSTSEIYGDVKDWHEDSIKVFPAHYTVRAEYGAGKMASEIAIINKAKVVDLSYVIIRPFNVAGPRQKPDLGFVLPRFVIAALTGQYITVYGDGLCRRAFTDVRDICDAIYMLGVGYEGIYNIGNPANEMSILDLAKLVVKCVGDTESEIVYIDPKKLHGDLFEEVPDKIPCIDKLKEIGWSPSYSIEQTINDAIEYYRGKIEDGYYFKVI